LPSDKPWAQFTQADYTIEQWKRACLFDSGQGDPNSKARYKLPVREPGGALNGNGVHAAAARLNQADMSPAQRATVARKLIALYHQLNEQPPESLSTMANRAAAQDVEMRNHVGPVELRVAGSRLIGGYAAVFNSRSQNLGGFFEMIAPSFFNKSRADGWAGAVCRYEHDDKYLLGSTRGNTLRLNVDETGLDYTVDVPKSREDVLEVITRGDISQSSYAFQVIDQEWKPSEGGYPQRTLISGRLIDVAPVATPAYQDTTVGLRSLAEYKNIPFDDVFALAAEDELRKLFVRTDNTPRPKRRPKSGAQALMEILAKRPEDPIGKVS
jgi:HK97 family phage prohead protease